MRRFLLLILAIITCLSVITGCAREGTVQNGGVPFEASDFPKEPPHLEITGGKSVLFAWRGTSSWNVKRLDGTGTGIQTDCPHPLDCIGNIPALKVFGNTTLKLSFEASPDRIIVRRYSAHAKDYEAYTEVEVKGNSLTVEGGNHLYEVIATWNESPLRTYYGTAYYAFCTAQ
jgi:hypothetical protein